MHSGYPPLDPPADSHEGCLTEDGLVFWCGEGEHYFAVKWPATRGSNFCKEHKYPARRVEDCVCAEIYRGEYD